MTESIAETLRREISIDDTESADFEKLLSAAAAAVRKANLCMTVERWLGLGNHLITTLRRANKGELLPPVDEEVLNQVDGAMQELSRGVLGAASVTMALQKDATEVLLLAVHFAAAKESN